MSASFLCFWHTSSSTVATQTPTRTEELDLLLVSHTRGTPQPPKWSSSPYVHVHDSPLSRYTIACGEWEWRVGWGLLINIHVHTRDKKWHSGRFIGVSEGGCIMFADVAYFGTLWSDSMHFSLTIQGFDLNRVIASLNPEPGKNESAGTWWECVCVNSYATRSDSALQQRKIKTKLQTGVAYDVNVIIPRFNCNREAVENLTFTDVPRRHVTLLSEATFERNAFHSSVFFGALLWLPPILPF